MSKAPDAISVTVTGECGQLKSRDRRALRPWELDEDAVTALEAAQPPAEATDFDDELKH